MLEVKEVAHFGREAPFRASDSHACMPSRYTAAPAACRKRVMHLPASSTSAGGGVLPKGALGSLLGLTADIIDCALCHAAASHLTSICIVLVGRQCAVYGPERSSVFVLWVDHMYESTCLSGLDGQKFSRRRRLILGAHEELVFNNFPFHC
jgi:hypothetical protein